MGSSDTSFVLTAATGWPGAAANNFIVVIDRGTSSEEKILCASNSGTTVTVASSGRGYDGTSATTHSATATVSLCLGAIDANEANTVTNFLGNLATGSMVLGAGTGVLPTALATGTTAQVLGGGTSPAWVGGSNGQFLGVSGGSLTFAAITVPTVLVPISKSSSYAAVNGNFVNVTATATITSPAAAGGAVFGAIANYGASNASPVTLTTASGYFIGPGIPASTSSILLGTVNAYATFTSDGTNWYMTAGAQDSGWITPALLNSFTSYSGAASGPEFRLTGNRVSFRGGFNAGTSGLEAFALPSGYRPTQIMVVAGAFVSAVFSLSINTTGACTPTFSGSPGMFLDGLTFTVD
jgi:hypothetical protein